MDRSTRLGWGSTVVVGVLALAALVWGPPARATEPMGDLGVQLHLLDLVPGKGPVGPSMTGVARIEVLVQAFRETRDVELRILRPDGSAWSLKGRPLPSDRPFWHGPGGEPLEPGTNGQVVAARGAIRSTIVVPLEGASVHEIVVAVTGFVGDDPIRTSAVVRVPLGVDDDQPVDDGIHANFSLQEVK